jgi:hypothetical protein
MTRGWPDAPESVMGSAEDQRTKAACAHRWLKLRRTLFGYMRVVARCRECGTWRGPRQARK